MAGCRESTSPSSEAPAFYPLAPLATEPASAPKSLDELEAWLTENGAHATWDGKLYVASTIEWNDEANQFRQSGCSPNYYGGGWTLACCKHDMRSGEPFRAAAVDLSIPTYVFTLARKGPIAGQPLVSVARIDRTFETMEDYATFLRSCGRTLRASRLTRCHRDDGLLGWRFGDCHANDDGDVGEPDPGHVHHWVEDWKRDTNGEHLILFSEQFILWERPLFAAQQTERQSRFGRNMDSKALREFFVPAENGQNLPD